MQMKDGLDMEIWDYKRFVIRLTDRRCTGVPDERRVPVPSPSRLALQRSFSYDKRGGSARHVLDLMRENGGARVVVERVSRFADECIGWAKQPGVNASNAFFSRWPKHGFAPP